MQLSVKNIFYSLAIILAFFALLVLAKSILMPLAFALLIAFILFPIAKKLETWGVNRSLAAFLAMFGLFLILAGGIFLFSNQIIQLSEEVTDFKDEILKVFAELTLFINQNVGFVDSLESGELLEKIKNRFSESSGSLLSKTFSSASDFFVALIFALVFIFLILIYRKGLISGLLHFYKKEDRKSAFKMLKSVQKVGQKYLFGMFMIIFILGLVNSLGLWIIGIDNPFLFGFLAGALAIIPYAGTLLGAAIPILYAFVVHDSIWMPVSIIIFFWIVQFTESNFLTPKIVGKNLKVNAMTSILSIIIGATVWGVGGMVLFLPFVAMFKVVCEEYAQLKPIALLIGDENYGGIDKGGKPNFYTKWVKNVKKRFS